MLFAESAHEVADHRGEWARVAEDGASNRDSVAGVAIAEAVVSSLSVAGETELQFVSDPGCSLPPKEALSLGLIVGELVTNAVKYAHPTGVVGKVMVSCRRASGGRSSRCLAPCW